MIRPSRLLGAFALAALVAPASAQQAALFMTAFGPGASCAINHLGDNPIFHYDIGATARFQVRIDNPRTTPIANGYFDFLVDDDFLLLVCDPNSYTLPPGAWLTLCDPGPGLPADGRFRIDGITVPAMSSETITLKAKISPVVPAFRDIYAISRFVAPTVPTVWSNPECCGFDPGIAVVIRPLPPVPPASLRGALLVNDTNGGSVLPGDSLTYLAKLGWVPCGGGGSGMFNYVLPLPPGLDFVAFTRCAAEVTCWYDPVVRRVFIDTTLPWYVEIGSDVEFEVAVGAGVAPGTRLCTQAVINGDILSDNPDDPLPMSATCVNVGGATTPALMMTKTVREDREDDRLFERGEWVRIDLAIQNHSLVGADDVHVIDVLPVGLEAFSPADVMVSPASGVNASVGAPAGLGAGVVEWGGIRVPGQSTVTVSLRARIAPDYVGTLCNAADLSSVAWGLAVASDDPATVDSPDPTCVAVVPERFADGRSSLLASACDATRISAGAGHALGVRVDGKLWAWGDNRHGQLGDGSKSDASSLLQMALPLDARAVAAGRYHSVAVTVDGRAWAWGDNSWGQLGGGSFTDFLVPVEVTGVSGVSEVAAGYFHSVALKSDGSVWSWGYNREGQLGDGTTTTSPRPVRVAALSNVVAVAAGSWHSLALEANGDLWTWGDNEWGQLGLGNTVDARTPQRVSLSGVTRASSRSHHTVAALADGTVWSWGFAAAGQLGIGSVPAPIATPTRILGLPVSPAEAVAAGVFHSLVSTAGGLFGFGDNFDGRLGDGTRNQTSVPVLSAMGSPGWSQLAAGDTFSLSIRPDGSLWSWGGNDDGQLGRGPSPSLDYPTLVDTFCAVRLEADPSRPRGALDSCPGGGNGDGYAEPGERIALELFIRNGGGADAVGAAVRAVLVSPPPAGVSFVDDTVSYLPSPLPAGGTAAPDGPFLIDLAPDIRCPWTVVLPVDIVSDQGTFRAAMTLPLGFCQPQCQAVDCQPLLRRVSPLRMVRLGTRIDATWTTEASATSGYALWSVATKDLVPMANQTTTARAAECATPAPADVQCLGATPVGTAPGGIYYQVLGVCGAGFEGPL